MLHWLHALPDGLIFTGAIALLGSAMLAAPWLGSILLRIHPNHHREELAFDAFKVVAATTSLVLGFSLVQVDGNLRSEKLGVGREAAVQPTSSWPIWAVPRRRRCAPPCAASPVRSSPTNGRG